MKRLISALTALAILASCCLAASFAGAEETASTIEGYQTPMSTVTQSIVQNEDGIIMSGYGQIGMNFIYYKEEKLPAPTSGEGFSVTYQVSGGADTGELIMIGLLDSTGWTGFHTSGDQQGLFLIHHPTTGVVELHQKLAGQTPTQLMAVDLNPYMDMNSLLKFSIEKIGEKYYFVMNGQGVDRGYVNGAEAEFILSDAFDFSLLADGCYLTLGATNFNNNINDRITLRLTEVNGVPCTTDGYAEAGLTDSDFLSTVASDAAKITFGADGANLSSTGRDATNFTYQINKKFALGEDGFSALFNIENALNGSQLAILAMLDGKGWQGFEHKDATGGLMLIVHPDTMVTELYAKQGGTYYEQLCAFETAAFTKLGSKINAEIKKNAAGKYNLFLNGTEITQAYVGGTMSNFVLEDAYDLSALKEGFYFYLTSTNFENTKGYNAIRLHSVDGLAVTGTPDFSAGNWYSLLNPEYFPQKVTEKESGLFFETASANSINICFTSADTVEFPANFSAEFSLVAAADGGQLAMIGLTDSARFGHWQDGLANKALFLLIHPDTMVVEIYAKDGNNLAQVMAVEGGAWISVGKHINYEIKKNAAGKYNVFLNGNEITAAYVGGVWSEFVLEDRVNLNAYFPNGAYVAVQGLNQAANTARQCISLTEINGKKLPAKEFAFDSSKLVNVLNVGGATTTLTETTLIGANPGQRACFVYRYDTPVSFPGAGFSTTFKITSATASQLAIIALMNDATWTGFDDQGTSDGLYVIIHPDTAVMELYVKVDNQMAQLMAADVSAALGASAFVNQTVKLELKKNTAGKLSLYINGTEITEAYVGGVYGAYLLENSFYYPMIAETAYAYFSMSNFGGEPNEAALAITEMNGVATVLPAPKAPGFELDKLIQQNDPVVSPATNKFLTEEGLVLVGKGTPRENFRFSYADPYNTTNGFQMELAMTSFAPTDMHYAFVLTDEPGWAGWDNNDRNGLLVIFINNSPTHLAVFNLEAGYVPEQVFITDEFICAKGDVLDVQVDAEKLVINGVEIQAYADYLDQMNTSVFAEEAYLSIGGFNFGSNKDYASRMVITEINGETLSGTDIETMPDLNDDNLNLVGNPVLSAEDFYSALTEEKTPTAAKYSTADGMTLVGIGSYRENFVYTTDQKFLFPQTDFTLSFRLDGKSDAGQLYALAFSDQPAWTGWNYTHQNNGFVLFFKPAESAVEIHRLDVEETPAWKAYVPGLAMTKGSTVTVSLKTIDGVVRLFVNDYELPEFVQFRGDLNLDRLADGSYLSIAAFNFNKNFTTNSQITVLNINENSFAGGTETVPGMAPLEENPNAPVFNFDNLLLVNTDTPNAYKSMTAAGLVLTGKEYPDANFIYGLKDGIDLKDGFSMEFSLDEWDLNDSGQSFGIAFTDVPFWSGYNYDNQHNGFFLLFQPQQQGLALCTLYPEEQPVPMDFVQSFVYEPGMKVKVEIKNEGGLYQLYVNGNLLKNFANVSAMLGVDELVEDDVYLTFIANNMQAANNPQTVTISNLMGRKLSGDIAAERGEGDLTVGGSDDNKDENESPDTSAPLTTALPVAIAILGGSLLLAGTMIRRKKNEI